MFKPKLGANLIAGLVTGLVFAAPSQAATVSYLLDQSNKLADGINYLQVTISDEGTPGSIDFTVKALQPLLDLAGENFGIQRFGFNVLGGVGAEAQDVAQLPANWRARNGGRMAGFGLFGITLKAKANGKDKDKDGPLNVQDPLTFSIVGVDLDTVLSYVDLSTGRAPQGFSLFSAQVTGLNFGNCGGKGVEGYDSKGAIVLMDGGGKDGGGKCVTSAYFGGASAVPAPPAVWLLATGIAGLAVRRFRSAKARLAA